MSIPWLRFPQSTILDFACKRGTLCSGTHTHRKKVSTEQPSLIPPAPDTSRPSTYVTHFAATRFFATWRLQRPRHRIGESTESTSHCCSVPIGNGWGVSGFRYPPDLTRRALVDSILDWHHNNLRRGSGAAWQCCCSRKRHAAADSGPLSGGCSWPRLAQSLSAKSGHPIGCQNGGRFSEAAAQCSEHDEHSVDH